MNVTVMSRRDAIEYCHKTHKKSVVMISISDPYITYNEKPFCSYGNRVISILPLLFTDADRPGKDVYNRNVTEGDLISESDAQCIHQLLNIYDGTDVIVHCDAGISRSSGVAAAILKAKTGKDSQIFDNPRYKPNMRCYRLVLNELMEG